MEITLSPEDNLRLANLCGVLDENIKQIGDSDPICALLVLYWVYVFDSRCTE